MNISITHHKWVKWGKLGRCGMWLKKVKWDRWGELGELGKWLKRGGWSRGRVIFPGLSDLRYERMSQPLQLSPSFLTPVWNYSQPGLTLNCPKIGKKGEVSQVNEMDEVIEISEVTKANEVS